MPHTGFLSLIVELFDEWRFILVGIAVCAAAFYLMIYTRAEEFALTILRLAQNRFERAIGGNWIFQYGVFLYLFLVVFGVTLIVKMGLENSAKVFVPALLLVLSIYGVRFWGHIGLHMLFDIVAVAKHVGLTIFKKIFTLIFLWVAIFLTVMIGQVFAHKLYALGILWWHQFTATSMIVAIILPFIPTHQPAPGEFHFNNLVRIVKYIATLCAIIVACILAKEMYQLIHFVNKNHKDMSSSCDFQSLVYGIMVYILNLLILLIWQVILVLL